MLALVINHFLLHLGSSFYVLAFFRSFQSNPLDAVTCGAFISALGIA